MTARDSSDIHRAQLADMPETTIEAWVIEHGGVIVDRAWYRQAMQVLLAVRPLGGCLPPGYPPRAEDDAPLPFEVGG